MTKKLQRKTKKTTAKKVVKSVKKPVAPKVAKTKEQLILSGSSELLPKTGVKLVDDANKLATDCARVLGISAIGITIMDDGMPYINKLGRKEKLEQYLAKDGLNFRIDYEWIQMSKNDTDKAVCLAFFVDNTDNMPKSSKIIGECSPATVKEYAGYQNHQAQTRAHNRLIEEVYGVRIHEEMVTNIAELKESGELKEIPIINTTVSAEEVEIVKGQTAQKDACVCESCNANVTKAEATFSKRIHKKILCRKCQPKKE